MESMHVPPRREPWNKEKLVGQKAPRKLRTSGQYEFVCRCTNDCANSRY